MANQFARPIEDTIVGGYTDAAAGVVDIFESIDEMVASDVDYVMSRNPPINDPYVVRLTPLMSPTEFINHFIRTRYRAEIGSEWGIDLFVELREEYVDETDRGTLIKQWTHALVPSTFTDAEDTLLDTEADDIVDHDNLYLRFVFNIAQEPLP